MKKIIYFCFLFLISFSCFKREKVDYVIGISQITSHKALDDAREGFKSIFKDENVRFIETNANGDISSLELNTKKLINQNVNLLYTISTPATQVAKNNTNKIPIVFSAVTDAIKSNVTGENITGVLDKSDINLQIETLISYIPNIKSIGILYNSSEQNSLSQVEEIRENVEKRGIKLIEKTITSINEVPQVIKSLLEVSDAIYTPADNLVASSINIIAESIIDYKKVSMGAEKAHVDKGILMSYGVDYYELGKEAGKIALSILKEGKKISDFEIKKMENLKFDFNEETAKKIGIDR